MNELMEIGRLFYWSLRYVILCSAVMIAGVALSVWYEIPSSELNEWQEKSIAQKADWTLIGNSMLGVNVDQQVLANESGKSIEFLTTGGVDTAWQYLAMKNIALSPEKEHKPDAIVLVTLGSLLTNPLSSIYSSQQSKILAISTSEEPVLNTVAYETTMNPLQFWMFNNIPFYRAREEIRSAIYPFARAIGSKITGISQSTISEDVGIVLNFSTLAAERAKAEIQLAKDYENDFELEKDIEHTLLPYMIDLAKESGVKLVVVRVKGVIYTTRSMNKEEKLYTEKLQKYLQENGVLFLDYSENKTLTKKDYKSGNHLSPEAAKVFARMLAEDLGSLLR